MSAIASTSLRQASRLCLKQPASAVGLLRRSVTARAVGISNQKIAKRSYVSETKKDSAQVNVDTAIRAEQKAFFAETGKFPENEIVPGASANADAMMSPIAGMNLCPKFGKLHSHFCRCSQASHYYGRGSETHIP